MNHIRQLYKQLDDVFTPAEAWGLFRFATYAETAGWFLLLSGIATKIMHLGFGEWYMPVAGTLHGVMFIGYNIYIFFAHPSMHWRFWHYLLAVLLSNIPGGALLFEAIINRCDNNRPH